MARKKTSTKKASAEVIPIAPFTPKGVSYDREAGTWSGGEFVSGTLDGAGLTTPGVPVVVGAQYAQDLSANGLATIVEK